MCQILKRRQKNEQDKKLCFISRYTGWKQKLHIYTRTCTRLIMNLNLIMNCLPKHCPCTMATHGTWRFVNRYVSPVVLSPIGSKRENWTPSVSPAENTDSVTAADYCCECGEKKCLGLLIFAGFMDNNRGIQTLCIWFGKGEGGGNSTDFDSLIYRDHANFVVTNLPTIFN